MIYRFKITSSEVDDFVREIEIGHEQTFLELHDAIQASTNYDSSQMASFYLIDDSGQRGLEIALFEMNTEDDDNMNVIAMDVAMIREFVSKSQPQLIYVFDFFSDRFFNVEFVEKGIVKSNAKYPQCNRSKGNAPVQIVLDAESFEGIDLEKTNPSGGVGTIQDDYLADFDDEFKDGPEFENLDDYDDLL